MTNAAAPTAFGSTNRLGRFGRVLVGTGAAAVLLTALVGVLHMPFAKALLRRLSPASLCPVTHGSAAQIDRAHAIGAAAIRASASRRAPSRPALGFVLEKTTRAELDAWAKLHGLSCGDINGNPTLRRCNDVPAAALGEPESDGPVEEVAFELRGTGALVSVQTLRRGMDPARSADVARGLERSAASALGAPTKSCGEPTTAHLAHGFLASYEAEHAFQDYRATISATSMGKRGIMVREQYLSVLP